MTDIAGRPVTSSPAGHVHHEDDPDACTEFCDRPTSGSRPALGASYVDQGEVVTDTNSQRAISVRQPWAWAIVHGGKDVENRGRREPWHTAIGERVLIHAAKTPEVGDECEVARLALVPTPERPYDPILPPEAATLGALIGEATVTGVHHAVQCRNTCSPWAQPDSWHITLADTSALPEPIEWRGALGLFEVPCP